MSDFDTPRQTFLERAEGERAMRDMSKAEFQSALQRHGFVLEGFMGYVRLNIPGQHICVSVLNAGANRRAQLAYLLNQQERQEQRQADKEAGV